MSVTPLPAAKCGRSSARSVRHAIGVLEELPPKALSDVVGQMIDRLCQISAKPDQDDLDEPLPPGVLRAEWDGFVHVRRKSRRSNGSAMDFTDAEPGLTRARSI